MDKKELGLRDYWVILSRRRWVATTVFLIFLASVLVGTYASTPVYRATAQIYIDTSGYQFSPQQQSAPSQLDNQAYIQTQIGILKSEAIAREVVSRLGLDLAGAGQSPLALFAAGVMNLFRPDDETVSADDYRDSTVRKFMDRLTVEQVKGTNLVNVSFESESPELTARVANEAVQTFIEQSLEMKAAPAKEYMGWLNEELGKIKLRMQESSIRLEEFKQSKDLVAGGERQTNIPLMSLTDLNSKVLAAEARRYSAEIKWQQVLNLSRTPDGLMSLPDVMNNKVVQDLRAQLGALTKQVAEQSKKYGEKHPRMIKLRNETATLEKQLKGEVELAVASIKNDYDEALKSESSLRAALSREKTEAMNYERRSTEYELRKQDVEGMRALYGQVLKKFQESDVMGSINISNVQMYDEAVPPRKPSRPNKPLNVLLGLVLGAFTAAGFALAFEHMDNTYNSPDELEEHLGLTVLGIVPEGPGQDNERPNRIAVVADRLSPAAESFRTIRSNILLARKGAGPRVIQVVSALRSEGKSTVSVNLACTMAASGEKTLLIDADLRRPSLHKVFNIPSAPGLGGLLAKKADIGGVLKNTGVPNLSFMPSGTPCANPGELLGSAGMRELMVSMRGRFDRIIIDCPPHLGIADTSLLTPLSDGAVLVVRSGRTIREAVHKIKKGMDTIGAEILGVVLNGMKTRSLDYYYHYNYTSYIKDGRREDKGAENGTFGRS